ncbi:hypothetical protein AB0B50_30705 [Streptomyces sp. NPDC041068]|uniref:hypothetical protein n=1 Tax=Streptomyces sp. NPDC041068 TaxID=3155130 RepID=UPI0034032F41
MTTPAYGRSIVDAQLALGTVRRARSTDLVELRRRLDTALSTAHTFRDPDLTDEANTRRRADMERKAREQAAADLDQIERATTTAGQQIRAYAEQTTAPAPREAAEQLLAEARQGRAWDRARALLEAGRSTADIISGADLDTLQALRAELPTYLAAQRTKPQGMAAADFTETDPTPVLRTIDRALVGKLPKHQGAALRLRLDLDKTEPGLRETLAGLRRQVDGTADGSDALRSAIAARFADQDVARQVA